MLIISSSSEIKFWKDFKKCYSKWC